MFGEDQFGFRRGKETRGAIGMLRVSECTLDIDVSYLNLQKFSAMLV